MIAQGIFGLIGTVHMFWSIGKNLADSSDLALHAQKQRQITALYPGPF